MRMLANWANMVIFDVVAPENEQYRGRMVGEIAEEQGREPWDVALRHRAAPTSSTPASAPCPALETDDDWKARVEIWRDGRAVIGASDAGAHLDLLASFNYATVLLGKAVRERQLLPLEEAVHLITDVPGAALRPRASGAGSTEGWNADVVVLDPTTVGSRRRRHAHGPPGGAGRLYAEADGIEHVLVNGTAIVRDGALTEARAAPAAALRARHPHPVTRIDRPSPRTSGRRLSHARSTDGCS